MPRALAAHGAPLDLLGRWRPSWARSAPAPTGERTPGGRRRRVLLGATLRPPCEPRAHHPHCAFSACSTHLSKDLRCWLQKQCAPGHFSPTRVSKPCKKPPTWCCSFPPSLPAPQAQRSARVPSERVLLNLGNKFITRVSPTTGTAIPYHVAYPAVID
eukprot:SAG31_NODE_8253_length_1488_cov_4.167747_1_plen_158_part_00